MLQNKAITIIANIVYMGKAIKEFNTINYLWYYIKGNPCKKCLVQACCSKFCFPKLYYNTGKKILRAMIKSFLDRYGVALTVIGFYVLVALYIIGFGLIIKVLGG